MVLKELKYQIPIMFNFYNVIDTVKEFGDFVQDIDPNSYFVNNSDFTYIKNTKLYRLYDKYSAILGVNENNIETCAISDKSIDEIIEVLNSKMLNTDTFIEISKELLKKIRMDTIHYVLELYNETKDMLDKEADNIVNDNRLKVSSQDMIDSIDDQFSNTTVGIVDYIYSNGIKYTLHNPCKGIYAICKNDKNKEIRFIEKTKFYDLLNNFRESTIENYWNLIADDLYKEIMNDANVIFMLSNRIENLELLLNYNDYSINGRKASLRERYRVKKLLKNSKIIS